MFRKKVYDAYEHRCAVCKIQLQLIEAAHIIPHSHEKGTDEINNGISLCALHHTAYDSSLIYFTKDYDVKINEKKMDYLTKLGLDSGLHTFKKIQNDKLFLPKNHILQPSRENIEIANRVRGIE